MAASGRSPDPRAGAVRRHLALWFPWLASERAARLLDPPPAGPFALVVRQGNALRLAAVDPAAAEAGLAPGMTFADARARCPDLASQPHDPAGDAAALDRITASMRDFSPAVMADPPGGVLIDITGCAHLFGGEAELARQAIVHAGYTARHAFAGNAMAARALVRFGNPPCEDVRRLPVAALDLADDALVALRRAGLRTVGDLMQRPAPVIAARFGEAAVLRLRQLAGEVASPLVPALPPAAIRAQARFAEPIARTDDVLDVAEDLLRQAAAQMEPLRLGGRRFVFTLCRSDGARRRLAVETGQPLRDPAPVIRLLTERIETLADPIDPGFGFDAVLLAVPRTEALAPRQVMLESGEEAGEDKLAALIDRLGVRLGPENVYRPQPCDRHLPEVAQDNIPLAASPAKAAWNARDVPPRPLYLLDPPQPIEVIAGVPDGPPQRFRWRRKLHDIALAEGPERIAGEWWARRGGHMGKGARTRDYYRIEDTGGQRYWVFRHGLFEEGPAPRWYLHGLFP